MVFIHFYKEIKHIQITVGFLGWLEGLFFGVCVGGGGLMPTIE